MVIQFSKMQNKTPRERERESKAESKKRKFVVLKRMGNGNVYSTPKLLALANTKLLSAQASRVKNLAEYFCISKQFAISQEKREKTASKCSCCNSSLSTPCTRSRLASSPPERAHHPDSTSASES